MNLELKFGTALCYCSEFNINGLCADEEEFGEKYDRSPDTAEDYGCGDMQFTRSSANSEILKKYSITLDEYNIICEKLEQGLSFGCCGWCV